MTNPRRVPLVLRADEHPWTAALLTVLAIPFALGAAIYILKTGSEIHWGMALGFALFLSVGIWAGLREMDSAEGLAYSAAKGIRIFIGLPLVAAVIAAWCSHELSLRGLASYDPTPGKDLEAFVAFYLWVLVDLLPGIKVAETLNWPTPTRPVNTVAGLPVLAFRIFVLLALLGAIKRWWSRRARGVVPERASRATESLDAARETSGSSDIPKE